MTRLGNVLAATFTNGGTTIEAIRHQVNGISKYYDQHGKSLAANFLLAPLEFRRISSGFGGRRHPVLGIFRRHQGTDYAASSGTQVRAIGDGMVIAAGVRGGYGNMIDVRHTNGIVTRYGHLRGFRQGRSLRHPRHDGTDDRLCRHDGPRDRTAPPLRGAGERRGEEPAHGAPGEGGSAASRRTARRSSTPCGFATSR